MRFASCLAILISLAAGVRAGDFVVIANPSLPDTSISANDLRQIYLGTKTNLNGRRVEPVIAQTGSFHQQFVSACLGETETGLRNYFRNLVFSGKGTMPRSFATSAEVVDYVARTAGTIRRQVPQAFLGCQSGGAVQLQGGLPPVLDGCAESGGIFGHNRHVEGAQAAQEQGFSPLDRLRSRENGLRGVRCARFSVKPPRPMAPRRVVR